MHHKANDPAVSAATAPWKILFVAWNYPLMVGGVSDIMHNLPKSLPPGRAVVLAPWGINASFHPRYNAPSFEAVRAFDAGQHFPIHRAHVVFRSWFRSVLSTAAITWRACRLARKEGVTLVWFSHFYPIGLAGLFVRLMGIPYVVHSYGTELMRPRGWLHRRLGKAVLRRAWRTVAISEWGRKALAERGASPGQIEVIHPRIALDRFEAPADMEAFREREGLNGKRVLLTVGRLSERKGQHLVIRALPQIIEKHPDVVYAVVGTGPDEQALRDEAVRAGVSDQVLFAGNRDVVPFYHACEIFVAPSLYMERPKADIESFGIVFIEANACGKPVIGANNGGMPDAVIDGETGFLVETGNVDALAGAIGLLLDDPSLGLRLGQQGKERVFREFGLSGYRKDIEEKIIQPLLAVRVPPNP